MEKKTKEELFDMFYKNNCEFPLECVEVLLMNGYFISHDLYWNVIMEYCKAIPLSENYTLEEIKMRALGDERVNRGREQDFFKILGMTREEWLSYKERKAKKKAIQKKILQIMKPITAAMWIFIGIVALLRLVLQ